VRGVVFRGRKLAKKRLGVGMQVTRKKEGGFLVRGPCGFYRPLMEGGKGLVMGGHRIGNDMLKRGGCQREGGNASNYERESYPETEKEHRGRVTKSQGTLTFRGGGENRGWAPQKGI